jgi:flavorubredoxin
MENKALLDEIEQLKQQIAHLTFKQNLLFTNGSVERLVFDYDLTQIQFTQIMDLMDEYRKMIGEGGKQVSHHEFEMQINAIVPDHGYHFAEAITYVFGKTSVGKKCLTSFIEVWKNTNMLRERFSNVCMGYCK